MTRIAFDISEALHSEAEAIAAEMGISIADIALSAFEGYLDGARHARHEDHDEVDNSGEPIEQVARLAHADQESVELTGTEPWLSTEDSCPN